MPTLDRPTTATSAARVGQRLHAGPPTARSAGPAAWLTVERTALAQPGAPCRAARGSGGRRRCRRAASCSVRPRRSTCAARASRHGLEQPGDDVAVLALRPPADDAPVDPHRRADVAVACRTRGACARRGTRPAPSTPSAWDRGRAAARPTARASATRRLVAPRAPGPARRRGPRPPCRARPARRGWRRASTRSTTDVGDRARPEALEPAPQPARPVPRRGRASSIGAPSQRSVGAHRWVAVVHQPLGRPRTTCPSAAEHQEHARRQPDLPRVGLPLVHRELDGRARARGRPARGRWPRPARASAASVLCLELAQPRPGPLRDAVLDEHLLEPCGARGPRDRERRRRVHDRRQVHGHREQRAPHAEHAQHRAVVVQGGLDGGTARGGPCGPTPRARRWPDRWRAAPRATAPPRRRRRRRVPGARRWRTPSRARRSATPIVRIPGPYRQSSS